MRTLIIATLLLLAACTEDPSSPDPGDVLLEEATVEPLALAALDATDRILPALAREMSASRTAALRQALDELGSALETRRAGPVSEAALILERALLSGSPPGTDAEVIAHEASVADLAALSILATHVYDAVTHTPGGTP